MTRDKSPDMLCALWQAQTPGSSGFSIDELRSAAGRLTRRVGGRNLREYIAAAFVASANVYYLVEPSPLLIRVGAGLIIAGVLVIAAWLYRKGSATAMPEEMAAESCIEFHRAELVRQRDLLQSVWKWYLGPLIPGFAVFTLGQLQAGLARPGVRSAAIIGRFLVFELAFAGIFLFIGSINHQAASRLQREIDALDALRQLSA